MSGRTKFRRSIHLAVAVALLALLAPPAVAQKGVDDAYDYPVIPGTEAWKALETHDEMLRVTQIHELVLAKMSTQGLVETVLRYPLLGDMLAYNSPQRGFDAVRSGFKGLAELLARPEAGEILLARYREMDPSAIAEGSSLVEEGKLTLDFQYIETLIAQDEILGSLAGPLLEELLFETLVKRDQKLARFDVYGMAGLEPTALVAARTLERVDRDFDKASDNLLADFVGTGWPATLEVLDTIFNRAEEHLFDEAASPTSAWRDGLELKDYNSTVYTPKGSAVPVTVMTWEFSGSTIAAGNAEIEAAYPNAVRETNTSRRYNCHSYAWYSLSTSNDKWMNTPGDDKYWQDGSYIPAPIIAGARVSYPASADHSAIAISASEYRSKWGQYPRMRHAPCYTPYTPCTPQNGYVRAPTVTVTGPSSREPNQSGTWTCSVSGGVPPFSYSWFKSYGGGGYTNLGTGSSKTASHPTSFNMVCDVTNSSGFVGSDFQFVNVDGDPDGPIFE